MSNLIVDAVFPGNREFTQAIDLATGRVVELRYKGYCGDFRKSGCNALESSQDAQSILDVS